MTEPFILNIAGLHIAVQPVWPETRDLCSRYLAASDDTVLPVYSFSMTPTDLKQELEKEQESEIQSLKLDFKLRAVEPLALYRRIAEATLEKNIWLMHGSVIAVDGEAYMFTAPSGTGKSTHSHLWRRAFGDRAVMVNDDKPLLRLDGDRVMACGTPWNGKHGLGNNIQVPLKGICILTRAEENRIEQLRVEDAFPLIYQQTYRPDDAEKLMKTLDLVDTLLKYVPVYQLQMNNYKEDAVAVCYNGMHGAEKTGHEE